MPSSTDRGADARPGTAGRLRQKLMQLSLTLTGIGVVLLVVSLMAVIWLRSHSNHLALKRAPAVVATQRAQIGLQRSLAGLRGWVVLGDESFRSDRRAAWTEQVDPAIDELQKSVSAWPDPMDRDRLANLARLLVDLKESQWWVEDVAWTEGNQPALHDLRRRVEPIFRSLLIVADHLVSDSDPGRSGDDGGAWNALSRFRRSLFAADNALARFVAGGEEEWRRGFVEALGDADLERRSLANGSARRRPHRVEQLAFIEREFPSYSRFAREVMNTRQGEQWNIALHLMSTETVPLTRQTTDLLNILAAHQELLMNRETNDMKFVGTTAIAASGVLILLMAGTAYALASRRASQLTIPVTRLSDATEQLAAGRLHEDIPVTTDDELATLTDSFNRMRVRLQQSEAALQQTNENLERHNRFVRETFGRYLSDDIVSSLLDTPGGLRLGGESREVTILMSDLRGFTSLAARLAPAQVVSILNRYLGAMVEVTARYQGTVDEFIGDAILVIFGAPVWHEDHASRAVACAMAMQLAMDSVNDDNRLHGLPEIEMGIGINTGEVVVGNIGSDTRAKYGVVGSAVNLTSRIESYTVGGQVFISDATRRQVGDILRVGERLEIEPKGIDDTVVIHDVHGIAGDFELSLPTAQDELVELVEGVSLRFSVVEGKHLGGEWMSGALVKLSRRTGEVVCDQLPASLTNLKFEIQQDTGSGIAREFYAKVTGSPVGGRFGIHMTSVPPDLAAWLEHRQAVD